MGAVNASRRFQNGRLDRQVRAWVAALDQHCVCTESTSWVVYVLGVHAHRDDIWIQIARDGDVEDTFVLRVAAEASAADALAALAQAPVSSESHPLVVTVSGEPGAAVAVRAAGRVPYSGYPRLYRQARPR